MLPLSPEPEPRVPPLCPLSLPSQDSIYSIAEAALLRAVLRVDRPLQRPAAEEQPPLRRLIGMHRHQREQQRPQVQIYEYQIPGLGEHARRHSTVLRENADRDGSVVRELLGALATTRGLLAPDAVIAFETPHRCFRDEADLPDLEVIRRKEYGSTALFVARARGSA